MERPVLGFQSIRLATGENGKMVAKLVSDFTPKRLIVVADESEDVGREAVCVTSILVAGEEMVQGEGGVIHYVFAPTSVDCGFKWPTAKTRDEITLEFINVGLPCRVFAVILGDDPVTEPA